MQSPGESPAIFFFWLDVFLIQWLFFANARSNARGKPTQLVLNASILFNENLNVHKTKPDDNMPQNMECELIASLTFTREFSWL